ncbi:BLUF domain-containing protein [Sphingomonas sp. G-3-2-10]|uniref:BLUF domain-containing protein n=1 Tax=Sphingomonas sp. G-3-2-10 TaxID=2728838 RepID=UPI0032174491
MSLLQIIYVSSAAPHQTIDPQAMLNKARSNNSRDGITGMLYFDGRRFMQAMEGPAEKVEATLDRIRADARHRAIVVLSRRTIETREFGEWAMAANMPGTSDEAFFDRVEALIANASPDVRATIAGFMRVRHAA